MNFTPSTAILRIGVLCVLAAAGSSTAALAAAAPAAPSSSPMRHADAKDRAARHHRATLSRARLERIQAALNQHGAQLAVDGRWGPKTRQAVEEFQRQNKQTATGRLDRATLELLAPSHSS